MISDLEKIKKIKVTDPFGAAHDAQLPGVALALDPAAVRAEFKHGLPRLAGESDRVRPRRIRVLRHKPGKRCVIEYDVKIKHPGKPPTEAMLIGKVRARRYGNEACRLLEAVWDAGFQSDSADGISVPEPIGVFPRFQMWLQRKVPGCVASTRLAGADGITLARRIAEAIHKLHRASVPTTQFHTMADELRILHRCLTLVARLRPELGARLKRIVEACERLGATVPAPVVCGIHRDFYPAQVIVDGSRIHLIDFDLYCQGDPALDLGNFIGHMTEESLRMAGDANALGPQEEAMTERYLELSGEPARHAVRAYSTLTLVRHIYLSTQFPERTAFTERFIELCERRLADAGTM